VLPLKPYRTRRRTTAWITAVIALIAFLTTAQTAVAAASPAIPLPSTITPSGFFSPRQVALAQFDGNLYMAWIGTDGNHSLNIAFSTNRGGSWSAASQFGANNSLSAPALVAFNGKLWMAWTGTDRNHTLNLASSTNGTQFGSATQPLGRNSSPYGPSLAIYNSTLYYGWTGSDPNHKLNIASSGDGVNFTSPLQLGTNSSINAPSLASVNGRLWMVWAGTDASHLLQVASSTTGFLAYNQSSYFVSTLHQPSIANYDFNISPPTVLFDYTGTDNNLYNFDDFRGPPPVRLGPSSPDAPAVTAFPDGTVVHAWIDNSSAISLCATQRGSGCG
jgi:hypothetical protein